MKSFIIVICLLAALAFFYAAYVYFTTPADALPTFFPGYDTALTRTHTTHAIASVILGLGALVLAWFQTGKK